MSGREADRSPAPASWAGAGVALAFVALGGFVTVSTLMTQPATAYARVGPHVFPLFVGPAMALIGLALLAEALRGRWSAQWTESDDPSVPRSRLLLNVALVAVGLGLGVATYTTFGFWFASAVTFALTSRTLGSRHLLRDLVIGAAFAGGIQLAFAYGLGLSLPSGTIWRRLPWMS